MALAEQQALITAYSQTVAGLRARALQILLTLFTSLGSWRDEDADRWLEQAMPVLLGAQAAIGNLTEAYLTALLADMLGQAPAPEALAEGAAGAAAGTGAAVTGAALRNGTPPEEAYRRPFVTVWTALSEGRPLGEARRLGEQRLRTMAATDLQLAKTHAGQRVLSSDDRVVGYRRTLTGSRNCALCIVASTQRYRRERLMPIHPNCDCGIAPIVGDRDPGQVINEPLLERVHEAVQQMTGTSDRGARAPDYRHILIEHEHGEIGAVLTLKGQHFTGPDDLT